MNRQRKVVITTTYNEMGIIIDTKAEELDSSAQPDLQPTCNQLATDCISRQAAIDVLDVLCQEHRYKIPGKRETYSQYNEAWQDALDRAEGAIFNLPSTQPEIIHCKDCKHYYYADNRIPQEQRYSCDLYGDRWKPEDFCSWAERKEEDDE